MEDAWHTFSWVATANCLPSNLKFSIGVFEVNGPEAWRPNGILCRFIAIFFWAVVNLRSEFSSFWLKIFSWAFWYWWLSVYPMEEFGSIILDNKNEELDFCHANIRKKNFRSHIIRGGCLSLLTVCHLSLCCNLLCVF